MAHFTIGVFGMLFDGDGRILLVRQGYGGCNWALPGGGLDPKEDPVAGTVREVREETGFEVAVDHMIGVYAKPYVNDIILSFRVREIARHPWAPDNEITAWDFFDPDALPEPISTSAKVRIKDAAQGKRGIFRTFYDPDGASGILTFEP